MSHWTEQTPEHPGKEREKMAKSTSRKRKRKNGKINTVLKPRILTVLLTLPIYWMTPPPPPKGTNKKTEDQRCTLEAICVGIRPSGPYLERALFWLFFYAQDKTANLHLLASVTTLSFLTWWELSSKRGFLHHSYQLKNPSNVYVNLTLTTSYQYEGQFCTVSV